MSNRYYEAHVTMVGDPAELRPVVEDMNWRFSAIEGDINLGDGVKCYATRQFKGTLPEGEVVNLLLHTAAQIEGYGVEVLRRKVEVVIYDDRSALVRPCDGVCPECHADELLTGGNNG